jgi:hypothetical protein
MIECASSEGARTIHGPMNPAKPIFSAWDLAVRSVPHCPRLALGRAADDAGEGKCSGVSPYQPKRSGRYRSGSPQAHHEESGPWSEAAGIGMQSEQ